MTSRPGAGGGVPWPDAGVASGLELEQPAGLAVPVQRQIDLLAPPGSAGRLLLQGGAGLAKSLTEKALSEEG